LKTKLHKIKITIKAGFQQDTKGTRPLTCAQNKQFRHHYKVRLTIICCSHNDRIGTTVCSLLGHS